jgi:hypothetical protein
MPVRVHYKGNELYPEGVVEVIKEADRWVSQTTEQGEAIKLYAVWIDEDDDSEEPVEHKQCVGRIAAGSWRSVIALDADADADADASQS